MTEKISICIATWCRKDYLEKIIHLLEEQSVPKSDYEIIVCDSYSNDGTNELMKELCSEYKNLRYINSKKNVLASKRNVGINAAKAPVVVFMDDDVFPASEFVEAHLSAHDGVENIIFCGQIRFPDEWVSKSNYYKYRDRCHINEDHKNIMENLPFNKIVVMNLSFKKEEVLNKVGLVNENFIGYGGEDTEFGYRIKKNGMKLVYLEEAHAYHYEKSPSIVSFGEKIFRSGRDGAKVLNSINPDIIYNTQLKFFEQNIEADNIKTKLKRISYKMLINKPFAMVVGKYLMRTDTINFLYNEMLYRYYLAYKYKEGILAQNEVNLTSEDVKSGWYGK